MESRDAEADLAVCEAASPWPWVEQSGSTPIADTGDYIPWCIVEGADGNTIAHFEERPHAGCDEDQDTANARFTATSREALPFWIHEASRLKLENQRLREAAEQVAWEAESCARGAGEEGDKGNSRAYRALASLARKALSPNQGSPQ